MKKKLLALVLCLSLTASVLSGCGSKSDSDSKVIKIGVFEPLTGENGGGGFQEVLGMRYANEVYPTVDIDGVTYDIELVEVDNKTIGHSTRGQITNLLIDKFKEIRTKGTPVYP